ncbi:MAG: hypothetical protein Q9217_004511 [Psora testacea]
MKNACSYSILGFDTDRVEPTVDSPKAEATRVYDIQLSSRSALRPEHSSSPAPWSNSQFTDSAIRDAVAAIYANASPLTAQLYRKGRPGGDNWVVRWVLYHVCRYRDSRNKKARSSKFEDDDEFFGPRPVDLVEDTEDMLE